MPPLEFQNTGHPVLMGEGSEYLSLFVVEDSPVTHQRSPRLGSDQVIEGCDAVGVGHVKFSEVGHVDDAKMVILLLPVPS